MKLQHAKNLPPDQSLAELQVNMSNALARSSHGLSLSEKRIVAACIAKTDQLPNMDIVRQRGAWLVRLSARDYAEAFDIDLNTAYDQLQSASENLFRRYVTTTRPTRKGPEVYKFVWVGGVRYHKGEGWVELDWWHEVVPHLFNLKGHFTKYKLKQASALRSPYSWRLFELFQSWQDEGRYQPTIEDFCTAMEVPASYLKNFKEVRRRVIEPAVQELIDKNNMLITWTTQNAGRKVIGLDFKFKPNPQQSLLPGPAIGEP
jgi:plasmid replication initiation protein